MPVKKVAYKEPASYFPKEIRKEFGLGEYNKDVLQKKTTEKTLTKKGRSDSSDGKAS